MSPPNNVLRSDGSLIENATAQKISNPPTSTIAIQLRTTIDGMPRRPQVAALSASSPEASVRRRPAESDNQYRPPMITTPDRMIMPATAISTTQPP